MRIITIIVILFCNTFCSKKDKNRLMYNKEKNKIVTNNQLKNKDMEKEFDLAFYEMVKNETNFIQKNGNIILIEKLKKKYFCYRG